MKNKAFIIDFNLLSEQNLSIDEYLILIHLSDDIDSEKYCNYSFGNVYDTYEQAFEFGLQEALKLINN